MSSTVFVDSNCIAIFRQVAFEILRSGYMLIGHWKDCWTLFTSNCGSHVRRWIPVLSSFFWTKFFDSCLCATVPLSATNQPQTGNKVNWYYSLVSWREGKGGCGRYQIQLRPSWLRVYCARELEHVSVVWCQYAWCLQNNHDAADWTLTGSNMKIFVKRKGGMRLQYWNLATFYSGTLVENERVESSSKRFQIQRLKCQDGRHLASIEEYWYRHIPST